MNLHNAAVSIGWNPENFKEVNEAKKIYLKARREGRKILDLKGNVIDRFHPSMGMIIIKEVEVNDGKVAMRIFDKTGDRRIIWDSRDPDEVAEAKRNFDEYINKGWKAYAVSKEDNRSRRIYKFDPLKEEIEIDERTTEDKLTSLKSVIKNNKAPEDKRTVKQKLAAFVEQFKEVKLMPKTFPG